MRVARHARIEDRNHLSLLRTLSPVPLDLLRLLVSLLGSGLVGRRISPFLRWQVAQSLDSHCGQELRTVCAQPQSAIGDVRSDAPLRRTERVSILRVPLEFLVVLVSTRSMYDHKVSAGRRSTPSTQTSAYAAESSRCMDVRVGAVGPWREPQTALRFALLHGM